MNAVNNTNDLFSKALNDKFKLLSEFGITANCIPNGYFSNIRSQRDLDLRCKELIAKKFMLMGN